LFLTSEKQKKIILLKIQIERRIWSYLLYWFLSSPLVKRFCFEAYSCECHGKVVSKSVNRVNLFWVTFCYHSYKLVVIAMIADRHCIIQTHHVSVSAINCPAAKTYSYRFVFLLDLLYKTIS